MKVNGIEIKISRKFFGHEGETCYQGTIYENGKKIGTWSDDAWCGPRNVSLDNPRKIGLLNDKIRSFFFEAGLMSARLTRKRFRSRKPSLDMVTISARSSSFPSTKRKAFAYHRQLPRRSRPKMASLGSRWSPFDMTCIVHARIVLHVSL